MEDDAPIIYGLEFQARALTAQTAETDVVRFLVGTQSLKFDNQIHLLEYDDENNTVNKTIFLHSVGEIWHIDSSPKEPSLISTCYNQISPDGKYSKHAALWKIPHDYRANNCCTDDSSSSLPSVELLMDLSVSDSDTDIKHVIWEPCAGSKIISVSDSSFSLWDLENSSILSLKASTSTNQKGRQKCISAKWNPHNNCNLLAVAIDSSVHSWDLRAMQPSWNIENAHGQLVRDLDFNPNKQYVLATCGDDCQIKFWDTRRCNLPLLILTDHSHWVWSVRYNNFHDQLVLSSSSDSRVILSRASSVSSEPFGHLVDDDEAVVSDETEFNNRKHVSDGVISLYEEHEDSVYAAEWSSADPWLFASLSYDGRLVINRVPRNEKYRILL